MAENIVERAPFQSCGIGSWLYLRPRGHGCLKDQLIDLDLGPDVGLAEQ